MKAAFNKLWEQQNMPYKNKKNKETKKKKLVDPT